MNPDATEARLKLLNEMLEAVNDNDVDRYAELYDMFITQEKQIGEIDSDEDEVYDP